VTGITYRTSFVRYMRARALKSGAFSITDSKNSITLSSKRWFRTRIAIVYEIDPNIPETQINELSPKYMTIWRAEYVKLLTEWAEEYKKTCPEAQVIVTSG